MPPLPEPGETYCRALEVMSSDQSPDDLFKKEEIAPRRPPARRPSYPTRAKIVAAVAAARAASIEVAGIRVWPDGSIAAFDSRGLVDQQPSAPCISPYDEWKAHCDFND
jgi:nicotinamidase-related amidase